MGDIDTAVRAAQQLEALLEQRLGAEGRGLHEKLSSVEHEIPLPLVKQIRWIASLRNRVVHEGEVIKDVPDFERAVARARRSLEAIATTATREPGDDDERPRAAPRGRRVRPRKRGRKIPAVVLWGLGAIGVVAFVVARPSRRAPAALTTPTADPSPIAVVEEPPPAPTASAADDSLAAKARRASVDAAQARKDIDELWRTIQQSTRVDLGDADVKDNGDGTSDVLVPVTWSLDPAPLLVTLNQYFWDYERAPIVEAEVDFTDHMGKRAPGIAVKRLWNDKNQKRPFSSDMLAYLTSKRARIRVGAGKYSGTITLAAGRKCVVDCRDFGHDIFQVHLRNGADPKILLNSSYRDQEQNPVRIAKVPNAALAKMPNPVATVEISPAPQSK